MSDNTIRRSNQRVVTNVEKLKRRPDKETTIAFAIAVVFAALAFFSCSACIIVSSAG